MRCVWHHCLADRARYEEIAGQLHGLLIRLDDRLAGNDITLIAEFIDADELGLALEQMVDVLSEDERPLAPDERGDMLTLGERMQLATVSGVLFGSALRGEGLVHSPAGQRAVGGMSGRVPNPV